MNYQPSLLSLPSPKLSVQLRFLSPDYELVLRDDSVRSVRKATFSGGQLKKVTLDMQPVEHDNVKLTYAARHIMIEVAGKLFARVLDVDFMRLHNAAALGAGESVRADESFGLL